MNDVRDVEKSGKSEEYFHSYDYIRHNQRRQEHLASLGLQFSGARVLEVAAGIGDHTSFFLDRGCDVTLTEGRAMNLQVLRGRFPKLTVLELDLDHPEGLGGEFFDVVYCYGALYHLSRPAEAIGFLASRCRGLLLLETCVSFGSGELLHLCEEPRENPTQSINGHGCRPTREWVYLRLKEHFSFVYLPITQPNHEEFPLDWSVPAEVEFKPYALHRAIFIASRQKLVNPQLVEDLVQRQVRH